MTERKPPEMSFTSWVDQQIHEAEKRGAEGAAPSRRGWRRRLSRRGPS